jgi:hypothetical protein
MIEFGMTLCVGPRLKEEAKSQPLKIKETGKMTPSIFQRFLCK